MTDQAERKQVIVELEEMIARFSDEYPTAVEYLAEAVNIHDPNKFFTAKERFLAKLRGEVLVMWDEIDPHLVCKNPNKVLAIKTYRGLTSSSLKESKEAVEARIEELIKLGKMQRPTAYYTY